MIDLSQAEKLQIIEELIGKELAALIAYQVNKAVVVNEGVPTTPEPCLQDQFYLLLIDKLIDTNPFDGT